MRTKDNFKEERNSRYKEEYSKTLQRLEERHSCLAWDPNLHGDSVSLELGLRWFFSSSIFLVMLMSSFIFWTYDMYLKEFLLCPCLLIPALVTFLGLCILTYFYLNYGPYVSSSLCIWIFLILWCNYLGNLASFKVCY